MWSSRWNENWQRKPKYSEKTCPSATCPPQIPHDLPWARTRATAVGSWRLTAWAMARPSVRVCHCIVGGWSPNWVHSARRPLTGLCTCPGWLWGWRIWWNEWQGKPKYSEKTCPGATLSTTNPTWPDPGSNLGRRGGKPATNRFSYGAAQGYVILPVDNLKEEKNSVVNEISGMGSLVCVKNRLQQFSNADTTIYVTKDVYDTHGYKHEVRIH
jgi:hypothetical protein